MSKQELIRGWDSSLAKNQRECPRCSHLMISSGHKLWEKGEPLDWAIEYWCEHEQELITISEQKPGQSARVFAKDFVQPERILLVNNESMIYNLKLRELINNRRLCDGNVGILTGNMSLRDNGVAGLMWAVEFWCDYDQELFYIGLDRNDPRISQIADNKPFDD